MESTLDYLVRKHETLRNDYATPDGEYSESCSIISAEVVKRLLAEGKNPVIMKVSDSVEENGFVMSRRLVPSIYEGRVTWGAHAVCCCDGLAYEPVLGMPIQIEEYCKLVFGKEMTMTVYIDSEGIKAFADD